MKKKQKGSILAFAVIIMSFLMIIAIGLVASSILTRKGANVSSNSTSAFQNTDKGMELFLYELYTNTKPFHTLDDLANSIVDSNGERYTCTNVTEGGETVAVINGAEFDVISYKEANPNDNDGKDFVVATSCLDTEIARVYKIKITGHFATASRSIEVNLSNSLKRGRIARWTFEGNTESVRIWGSPGAPVVKDRSKNDYILTLCPIEEDADLSGIAHFNECPRREIAEVPDGGDKIFMNHMPKWYTASIFDKDDNWVKETSTPNDDDRTCRQIDKADKEETDTVIPCGGYVAGVVSDDPGSREVDIDDPENRLGIGTGRPIDPGTNPDSEDYYNYDDNGYRIASEAMEFNGLSHYLAPNIKEKNYHEGGTATNYVKEGAKEGLNLNDSEGLAISLWVNNNSETGDDTQMLIYKVSGTKGYALYLKDDKLFFWLNNREFSTNFDEDNSWHHVVARYDDELGRGDILIDGESVSSGLGSAGSVRDEDDSMLFIGAEEGAGKYFGGMIDNVEIYNRYLINFEVQKLCNRAVGEGWQNESGSIADLCEDVVW